MALIIISMLFYPLTTKDKDNEIVPDVNTDDTKTNITV
jgi:hypothetical protein